MTVGLLVSICALVISLAAGLFAPLINLWRDEKQARKIYLQRTATAFFSAYSELNPNHDPIQSSEECAKLMACGFSLQSALQCQADRDAVASCVSNACNEIVACEISFKTGEALKQDWGNMKVRAMHQVIELVNKQLK